jgi:hypothetical protein
MNWKKYGSAGGKISGNIAAFLYFVDRASRRNSG